MNLFLRCLSSNEEYLSEISQPESFEHSGKFNIMQCRPVKALLIQELVKSGTSSRNYGLHFRGQTPAPFISFTEVMIRSSIVDLGIKGDVTRPLLGLCKGIISWVGTPDLSFVLLWPTEKSRP